MFTKRAVAGAFIGRLNRDREDVRFECEKRLDLAMKSCTAIPRNDPHVVLLSTINRVSVLLPATLLLAEIWQFTRDRLEGEPSMWRIRTLRSS